MRTFGFPGRHPPLVGAAHWTDSVVEGVPLEPGTQLAVRRRLGYTDHGIYIGNGNVVQFGGRISDKQHANVEVAELETFLGDSQAFDIHTSFTRRTDVPRLPADEVVKRSVWLVHNHPPGVYNALDRNCETISNWVTTGGAQF